MRIHTDKPEAVIGAVYAATRHLPGVYATITRHGSRSRDGAIELRLEGNGTHRNSGQWGADTYEQAATWDEWGVVLAKVFEIDPKAFAGSAKRPVYASADHYHLVTDYRFLGGELPKDTHKRHNWDWTGCTKCSAVRDFHAGDAYLDYWKTAA